MTSLPEQDRQDEARPGHRSRHLRRLPRLRGELQGMEHERPFRAADRLRSLRRRPERRLVQPHPHLRRLGDGGDSRTVHFPKSCLHCADAPCVTVCPTGASYKREEDGIVLVNADICIGCKLCSWACPYGAREYDEDAGRDEEVHALHRPDLQREPGRGEPRAGLRLDLPGRRAAFRRSRRPRVGRLAAWSRRAAATT